MLKRVDAGRVDEKRQVRGVHLPDYLERRSSHISVEPAMNFEPSGEMDNTVDCPVTDRLFRITPEAASYTNRVVNAELVV